MCLTYFLVLELSAEEREDVRFKQVTDCYVTQNLFRSGQH